MQTQTTQIRVTLPVKLQGFLQTKANKYGLSLSGYIRNLVINDVQDVKYPVFEMSDQSVSDFHESMEAEKNGNLVVTDDVSQLLKDL
ncbi:MAG: hypothetical protein COZ34_01405 [Candidatus Pacebacteria bacterium CG_4_10_14_3_um_filter_34_15]|nr:hypothetical protein [Candidatus Pacearchaeota archaeon]NCQ65364.1 hypothetical protein [Candidatus Paceibacterota bacterium]OIO44252.1 MAG: hypothetical protein AUJ41_03670 [Candidatus Pacebacteria bacterium CG1_02_43_31]PIQ80748.1 MAG: hypothetical protein COV78_03575 [Candidatus Pacebacteria bacterium CG11_big_fil_rev_8_21_14_0_20_34_55]PIX81789.1 MAG: hypothetical protein COZ34_01405 [Candidatus Pacebacteria bacterium CG_4_10_14_3_um_filter_34_15]PJC43912.1 MAG: hypothetical protein CO0